MTDENNKVVEETKKLHPDFQINLVNELDLDHPTHPDVIECLELCKTHPYFKNFLNSHSRQEYYGAWVNLGKQTNSRKRLAEFSTILRQHLLNKYGGIYLDLDIEWKKPLDEEILSRKKFLMSVPIGTRNGIVAKNGCKRFADCFFMGSEPGMIDDLMKSNPGVASDMNLNWPDLAEGNYVGYEVQPYIIHKQNLSYVEPKNGIIEERRTIKGTNMKLQILIPQYKETPEVIKPMLDSIALQQGIDLNEVGVVIVNDGNPESKLPDEFLKSYPFQIDYYLEEHRGVSGTRNACLDHATAEYVMFCDADDMFFSMVGLNVMMKEMDKGFNALVTKFYEEANSNGRRWFIEKKMDRTFVHGKFYRRAYLVEKNIRFNEKLTIHEDSYFNFMATVCADDPDSIKYSDVAIYLWKWRQDSVCRRDPLYMHKTFNFYMDSITSLVAELNQRYRHEQALVLICNMMFDTYYLMNTPSWLTQENQEYRLNTEKRFKLFYEEHQEQFYSVSDYDRMNISNNVRASKIKEGMGMEKQTFEQWLMYITGLDASDIKDLNKESPTPKPEVKEVVVPNKTLKVNKVKAKKAKAKKKS